MGIPSAFHRLVRFVDNEGQVNYGELDNQVGTDGSLEGLVVSVYEGKGPLDSGFVLGPTKKAIAKAWIASDFDLQVLRSFRF
jgi:hypothetical protein